MTPEPSLFTPQRNSLRLAACSPPILRPASLMLAGLLLAGSGFAQDPVSGEQPPVEAPQIDVQAEINRRRAAESRQDFAAAAVLYEELTGLDADNWRWYVRGADCKGKSGDANEGLDLLDIAARRFPDVADVFAMQAKIFHLKADQLRASGVFDNNVVFLYEDARRTAEKVLQMQSDHFEARLLIASASFQLGDSERALKLAREVTASRPTEYGGHAMVGRVLFQQFVTAKQAEDEERAAEILPQAIAAFEQAARADRKRSFPVVKLGDLQAWIGETEKALEQYRDALGRDANAQVSHDWLRSAVEAGKRRELYRAALTTYRQARPDDTRGAGLLRWYEAQCDFDANDWEAAAVGFRAAFAAMPEYTDTRWWVMQSLFWSGEVDEAAKVAVAFAGNNPARFADMIRRDDQTIATLIGMAAEAYNAGRIADSRDLNQVIAYAKQTSDAWNNYAFLCRETRQYDDSLRGYESALTMEPDSPQLLNDAAVIMQYHLRTEANLAKARDYYQRAIKLAEEQMEQGLTGDALDRVRVALRDARNNLRALEGGGPRRRR